MENLLNNMNNALKTKEDRQHFVLVVFVLFILFVKFYMLVAGNSVKQTVKNSPNTKVKTAIVKNNI